MSAATDETDVNGDTPDLKRVMGPKLLLLFVVGDILGAGVYAVTGQMAGVVGGIVWLPFLVAFAVATLTALSYLELVTKYPQAAGAALYTHKAFGVHFITFLVAFAVMSSGITSASTAARAFSANAAAVFDLDVGEGIGITLIGLGFMTLVALVNFRGVGESVKANVVLTCIELSGLLLIIGVGIYAVGGGEGDPSRLTQINTGDSSAFVAITAAMPSGTGLDRFAEVFPERCFDVAIAEQHAVSKHRHVPAVLLEGRNGNHNRYVAAERGDIGPLEVGQIHGGRQLEG